MKIYSAIQIGEYHQNHCEDYLFTGEIGNKILCAVMDGCTMGEDSYFISALTGKILRKIVKERSYREWYEKNNSLEIEEHLKQIVQDLFKELRALKNQLMLEDKKMLTTLILLLFNKDENQGIVLVIGDGTVVVDENIQEFDQENKPDYIGYHLHEDFDSWYIKQNQKIFINNFQDVSIATDGISMFSKITKKEQIDIDPVEYLLVNRNMKEKENMLDLKLKVLEHQYGMKPTDDLAVIRVIL